MMVFADVGAGIRFWYNMITINITEFEDYERVSAMARETKKPIFVEEDGEIKLVFMTIELYKEMFGEISSIEIESATDTE